MVGLKGVMLRSGNVGALASAEAAMIANHRRLFLSARFEVRYGLAPWFPLSGVEVNPARSAAREVRP